MTKEIHDINTRALDFVVELIEYIFEYPDDDYMTMECLCRKLHKHGLIEKKDGEWTTDFIDRKTENSSEKPNNSTISKMEQVEDGAYFLELMGAVERGEISDAGANQAWYEYINHKDEPQTDCSWK